MTYKNNESRVCVCVCVPLLRAVYIKYYTLEFQSKLKAKYCVSYVKYESHVHCQADL